jgi:hypothetical protein
MTSASARWSQICCAKELTSCNAWRLQLVRCGAARRSVARKHLEGLDVERSELAVLSVLIGVIVYVSADVTIASLAFWISGARSFARDLTAFLLLLCSCPGSIRARPS